MADYVFVTESIPPLSNDEAAGTAVGLARALMSQRHKVTILALGAPGRPQTVTGLARRLRKVPVRIGEQSLDLSLFEGRFSASDPTLYVLEVEPGGRARTAAALASGALGLAQDGLLKADAILGWGETSATALARLSAPAKLFVLPTAELGPPLDERESEALHLGVEGDRASARSLAGIGAVAAHVVVAPSPTAARQLEATSALAARASDEPVVAVRLGCDEPPNDPASDAALAARFSAEAPAGKAECRKLLARRLGLPATPRTLILGVEPLRRDRGGREVLAALPAIVKHDVVVVVAPGGDRELTDRAGIAAIEHPSRIALLPEETPAAWRGLLGAADAVLFTDADDATARAPSRAIHYGALPIAPNAGAPGDFLVDYEPRSNTGSAILYPAVQTDDLVAAVLRAAALKADVEGWGKLVRGLLSAAAPSWARTAERIETLRVAAEHDLAPAA